MSDTPVLIQRVGAFEEADVAAIAALLDPLIRSDAALGWTEPPSRASVRSLLQPVVAAAPGDACLVTARHDGVLVGFGYWTRYSRATHRPHADLEKLAVAGDFGGRGIGRGVLRELVTAARDAGIEQLTLDFRGDNARAEQLYLSEGFVEYGRLRDFVAPDTERRFDKVLQVLDLRV